jgi:hypothetical protein
MNSVLPKPTSILASIVSDGAEAVTGVVGVADDSVAVRTVSRVALETGLTVPVIGFLCVGRAFVILCVLFSDFIFQFQSLFVHSAKSATSGLTIPRSRPAVAPQSNQ